jgi:hypothetical protein
MKSDAHAVETIGSIAIAAVPIFTNALLLLFMS